LAGLIRDARGNRQCGNRNTGWPLAAPIIHPAKRGGGKRTVNIREVLNGIFYLLWTGCQWKPLPKDLPPKSTVHWYFMLWEWDGTLEQIYHLLYVAVWEQEGPRGQSDRGNHQQPERQSGAKRGASLNPQGYDAGKKATGRKRHILVDTLGLLLSVAVHPANVQDRDSAALVPDERTRALWPFILKIFADAGYQGARAALAAARVGSWVVVIVKRTELHKFAVLPKRWIVERTLVWISRNRRLARDYERYTHTAAAFIRLAMIRLMRRRLTRSTACP
jgi:transposase